MTQNSTNRPSAVFEVPPGSAARRAGNWVGRLSQQRHSITTTPGQLSLLVILAWSLAILCAVANWNAVEHHRHEMQTVGRDTAPSIIAAENLKSNLAQMHGDIMREFLSPPTAADNAAAAYDNHRAKVSSELLAAAENITYGDDERTPIRDLLTGLASYDQAIARALLLHDRHDATDLTHLNDAEQIMRSRLFPAADMLDQANQHAMDRGYSNEQSVSAWTTSMSICCAMLLVAGLLGIQLFIRRRMRRRISFPLAAATLFTIAWALHLIGALDAESANLKIAKQDAFDSIGVLCRGRADAGDCQAQLTRALVDPQVRQSALDAFARAASKLARDVDPAKSLPYQGNVDPYLQGPELDELVKTVDQGTIPTWFHGYLADELRNITFDGERQAAVEMLTRYAQYMASAKQATDAEQPHNHAGAVQRFIGSSSRDVRLAHEAFLESLDRVIAINQGEFDNAVASGFDNLNGLGTWTIVMTLLIALLAQWGVAARLREYSV